VALVGWLHAGLLRLLLWAARFLGRSLWNTVGAFLALLGEEVRRYLGLALWAVVIWLAGKATMNYAPPGTKTPLVLVILGLVVIWGLAVVRAVRFTRHNNLIRVRQRQYFRELRGEVSQVGERVTDALGSARDGLAKRAKGTPAEGLFWANRDEKAKAEADAHAAAEQAEREQTVAAEWGQAVAAKRAERERFAAEAAERWANRQREGA
jgi:hypothetical protein